MKKLLLITLSFIFFWGFIWASTSTNGVISRMYQNWLTKFDNSADFMETKPLRRDEASKFFVQYTKQLLNKTNDETKTECNKFSDLNKWRSDLSDTMKDSCKLWLFQWNKWKFMPTQTLTKWQAITVLIRMIDGKKDETQWHFAQKYYERALELWILNWVDINPKIFDYLINRWDVARLLYNAWNIWKNTTSNNNGLSTVCINGLCTSWTSITCKGGVCTSNTTTTTTTTINWENPDLIIESLIASQGIMSNTWDAVKYYWLSINYIIKNQWNGDISISYTNPLKLNCYYNWVSIMNADVAIWAYNSPKKIWAWWKISWSIGTYQHFSVEEYNSQAFKNVKCVIDEDNIIIESNENNNERYIDSTS